MDKFTRLKQLIIDLKFDSHYNSYFNEYRRLHLNNRNMLKDFTERSLKFYLLSEIKKIEDEENKR